MMKSFFFLGLLLVCAGRAAEGQEIDASTIPIAELLERWVDEQVERGQDRAARNAIAAIFHRELRPPGDLDALIDGLADLVSSGPTKFVRFSAASTLAMAGFEGAEGDPARIASLLTQLFAETTEGGVRLAIVGSFGSLRDPGVGIEFLRRVLTEEPPSFALPLEKRNAVASALAAGAKGRALLLELHQAGSIREPTARAMVAREHAMGRLTGGD